MEAKAKQTDIKMTARKLRRVIAPTRVFRGHAGSDKKAGK